MVGRLRSILALGALVALVACSPSPDDGRSAAPPTAGAPVTVEDVLAAAERTRAAGSARLRWTQGGWTYGARGGPDEVVVDGRWDFARHQGTFTEDGGRETRVVHGAVFRRLTADERADQSGNDPEYRYAWQQSEVDSTATVEDDPYFGLALEGSATVVEAFRVLDLAASVEALPPDRDGALRGVRVGLPDDLLAEGYRPPELWLDGDGRVRRLRLAAGLHPGIPDLALTVELGPFGVPVDVAVPPVDDLNPSGSIVPVGPWEAVGEVTVDGRHFRLLSAPDNRSYVLPERRQGRCGAVVPVEDDVRAPPRFYECFVPRTPEDDVTLGRRVHPDAEGRVVVGAMAAELPGTEVAFDDGSTASVAASGGVFAVVVPEGRRLAAVAGTPVEQL